jgi:hypothetical protein
MKIEQLHDDAPDDLDRPLFVQHVKLRELEKQLYGHVLAAIDLDALSGLGEHLTLHLMEHFELDDHLAMDLADQVMNTALRRVIDDPSRQMSFGAPDGITQAEKDAVAFDETCPFCLAARQDRERAKARTGADEPEEEYCACCEMVRESWREKHALVLAKAGLGPPSSAAAVVGAVQIAKRDRARREKPS